MIDVALFVSFFESLLWFSSFQATQWCPTFCNPMDHSTPGLPVHRQLLKSTQTHVHLVGDATQPSHPRRPLLLLPSISPSIRVLSNESALCMRWPKYWNFSFNISSSNEHPGLIPMLFLSLFLLSLFHQQLSFSLILE